MADSLFLSSVRVEDGEARLGFAPGRAVTLGEAALVRERPDGTREYAMTLSADGEQFELRTLADADGRVVRVCAGAGSVPDDWCD